MQTPRLLSFLRSTVPIWVSLVSAASLLVSCDQMGTMDGPAMKRAAEAGEFGEIDQRIEGGYFADMTRLASILAQVNSDDCVPRLEKIAVSKDRMIQLAAYEAGRKLSPDRRRRVMNVLTRSQEEDVRRLASEALSKLNLKESTRKPL